MKNYILITYFILLGFSLTAQNNTIDSLKQLVQNQKHDTSKLKLYIKLAEAYHSENLDTVGLYFQKAFKLSRKNNDYKLVNIYSGIGLSHFYTSNIDSARYYYDKGLALLTINDDTLVRATIYSNYSLSYEHTNENEKRIDYNLKAIDLVKNNDAEVCFMYYNQGTIYYNLDLKDQALKYFELAFSSSEKANILRVKAGALHALAIMCIDEEKYEKAKKYIDKALVLCEEHQSPEICYFSNNQLGIYYKNLKRLDEANIALLKAKSFAQQLNRKHDIIASNITLAQNEYERGNYTLSTKYFEEFENLYLEESIPSIGIRAYKDWARTEAKREKYKKAYELLLKSSIIKDSTLEKENKQVLADAQEKYETEKKDKELAEQKLAIEENQLELQKRKTQNSIMTAIAIFLLVSSLLGWFLFQQRQKRKNQEILTLKREQQVKTLESLIEGEEKERFRMAKELHDGVNGDLSAIKYKLTSMLEHNTAIVNEVVAMIDKSSEQVRAISHNLVPPSLEKFNLVDALEDYCITMNEIHEPEITYQHLGNPLTISKNNEINLFRIVQELVSNSIKHSGANSITVQTSQRENVIQLTVEDNGAGFDPTFLQKRGIGLQNIDSRIEYLNATKDFISNSKGTSYTIEIDTFKLNDY